MKDRRTYLTPHPDPHPDLPICLGTKGTGVGSWVPHEKHRLLADFVQASWAARSKFKHRAFVDLMSGPGRLRVEGEIETRPGGAVVAWRQSQCNPAGAFTQVIVGDLDQAASAACGMRLRAAGAPVTALFGPASQTAVRALQMIPRRNSLCLAYLDPYNLQALTLDVIQCLAQLERVDFVVHFSTMDLVRNVELDFERGRFDDVAPGWQDTVLPQQLSRRGMSEAFFDYWCGLVRGLGFEFSERMPLIRNDGNAPLYRLTCFSRSPLPNRLWKDVARPANGDLFES